MSARFPALGFDPAPGEPEEARVCAREHRRAAAELDRLATEVARLPGAVSAWRGAAATAFSAGLAPLLAQLREAAQALAATGSRLSAWADELEDLQERARGAERSAAEALERRSEAHARAPAGSHVVDAWDADDDLRRAAQQADEVRATWREGGRRAAAAVSATAAAAPPLPDGLGELVWQHRHAISWAADISAVASLPAAFVPVVGPVAGAALGAAGLAGHAALAAYADGATSDVLLGVSVLGLGGASAAVRQVASSPAGEVGARVAAHGLHYGEVALGAVGSALTVQKRVQGPVEPTPARARPDGAASRLLVGPVVGQPSRRRR